MMEKKENTYLGLVTEKYLTTIILVISEGSKHSLCPFTEERNNLLNVPQMYITKKAHAVADCFRGSSQQRSFGSYAYSNLKYSNSQKLILKQKERAISLHLLEIF